MKERGSNRAGVPRSDEDVQTHDDAADLALFRLQMAIWGYACKGHDGLAYVVETGEAHEPSGIPWWDRTLADLNGEWLIDENHEYQRVPYHWALPGLAELRMQEAIRRG